VLLGNAGKLTGDVLVRFTDLDKAPWLPKDGKVHATVERIPDDKGAAVLALPTVSDEDLAAKDGVLEVTIPWTSDRDAYAVHLGGK
jgi:hypothetical protein